MDLRTASEPMLQEDNQSPGHLTIKNQIWRAYKDALATFWVANTEINSSDINKWRETTSKEHQDAIYLTFRMFAYSINSLSETLETQLINEVKIPEARCVSQDFTKKNIHTEVLWTFAANFYANKDVDSPISTDTPPGMEGKRAWIERQKGIACSKGTPLATKLMSLLTIREIFYGSLQALIRYFISQGIVPPSLNIIKIFEDQERHNYFLLLLIRHFNYQVHAELSKEIIIDAVNIEKAFAASIDEVITRSSSKPPSLDGMSKYIEFLADRLLADLGLAIHYNTPNPVHPTSYPL
ncbi:hypothetical protein CVT26_011002 [Gymnopilus dilepis]|uniref:Uncharacterized protein n=1 Tax=Gymnopilus dilepis TaxID=231916 RepID=A0A409VY76_9AGAR|nr:hypothetical protein CVT26_011002 [Gymnopilus dilepis]